MKLSTEFTSSKAKPKRQRRDKNSDPSLPLKQENPQALEIRQGGAQQIKKKRVWPLVLMLVFCCYLLIAGVILAVVWGHLVDYEVTLPQNVADKIAASISNGDYSLLSDPELFSLSEYEGEEQRQTYLSERMSGLIPLRAQHNGVEGEGLIYNLVGEEGGESFALLELMSSGEYSPYGRTIYNKARITSPKDKALYVPHPDTVISAPSGTALLVNGKPLSAHPSAEIEISEYVNLKNQQPAPRVAQYRLTGLLLRPEVTVADDSGCVVSFNEEKTEFEVSLTVPDEVKNAVSKLAEEASLLHARIITRDATFSMLKPYLLPWGPAYNSLMGFDNSYYISHESYGHKDMEVSEFKAYDENRVSCVVKFDYFVKKGKKEFHYPTHYTVFLTRANKEANFLISQVRPH